MTPEPKMHEHHSVDTDVRISVAARLWIFERSAGIYRQMPGGNPVLEGSGVLLQIADSVFLLSAGHVLKAATEAAILIGPMVDNSRPIRVDPPFRISRDEETVDVGFVRLADVVVRELARHGKKFVRLSETEILDAPMQGLYSVVGYPKKTNSPDYDSKRIDVLPICYATYLCPANVDNFAPGVSIALSCTKETVVRSDGEPIRMPHLGGISGCGMWRLYGVKDRTDRLDTWAPSWIRLAGIEHRWLERKYIKGTLIRRVIDLIAEDYPDLRASIRLTIST